MVVDLDSSKFTAEESFQGRKDRIILAQRWFKTNHGKKERLQFPVNLTYAQTIHKIQGQTLDKVRISFGTRKLPYGLATVAFSRTSRL